MSDGRVSTRSRHRQAAGKSSGLLVFLCPPVELLAQAIATEGPLDMTPAGSGGGGGGPPSGKALPPTWAGSGLTVPFFWNSAVGAGC